MTTTEPSSLTGVYQLDPARTRLGFVASHVGGVPAHGTFEAFDGRIHLDFTEPERSSAEVIIDAGSLNTRNTLRDKQLRSRAFFQTGRHPRITFGTTSVRRVADDRFRLEGALTIKGVTKPVTVDLVHAGTADDGDGTTRVEFGGGATLDRRDWGLTQGGFLISNQITVELEVSVVRPARGDCG